MTFVDPNHILKIPKRTTNKSKWFLCVALEMPNESKMLMKFLLQIYIGMVIL